jgi:hypothetical protein
MHGGRSKDSIKVWSIGLLLLGNSFKNRRGKEDSVCYLRIFFYRQTKEIIKAIYPNHILD